MLAVGMAFAMALPVAAESVTPLKMMRDAKMRVFDPQSSVKGDEAGTPANRTKSGAGLAAGQMRMSELAMRMKPGTTKTFGWYRNSWTPEDLYTYTYDADGNVVVELCKDAEGDFSRTVNEYNENGKVISRDVATSYDGVNFNGYKKSAFEYDPILTDVIILRTESICIDGEWHADTNNYRRIINRDAEGNITSVVIAVLFQGKYDPTQRLTITYGEDGKASTITEEILGYDGREYYWEQAVRISNIVWDRTDGQIYDPEDLFTGNNRIGSARYEDSDDLDMNVTVEYADDSDAYTAHMTMTMDGMSLTAVAEYIPLENDGYIGKGTTYFMDMEMFSSHEEFRYDDWGLMTLSYEAETEGDSTYAESVVGEVEYDQEGKPLTYTISERYTDEYTGEEVIDYVIRAEYSDYIDVKDGSGVDAFEADGAESYYDLNGFRMTAPEKGRIVVTEKGTKRVF